MRKRRWQTLGEEIANAVSHGVGALLAIAGLVLMILKAKTAEAVVGVTLFGVTAIMLYTMSCLYHSFKKDTIVKRVFRRFDHLSIYLLIGGTYLPIFLIIFKHPIDVIFICIQWSVITLGVILKSVNFKKYKALHIVLYLILGWSGVAVFQPLWAASKEAFFWILGGGVAYTLGVVFYALKWKYSHFVWHLFVIAGTTLHFFAIYLHLL